VLVLRPGADDLGDQTIIALLIFRGHLQAPKENHILAYPDAQGARLPLDRVPRYIMASRIRWGSPPIAARFPTQKPHPLSDQESEGAEGKGAPAPDTRTLESGLPVSVPGDTRAHSPVTDECDFSSSSIL
jgi:hypothetical protein